MLPSLRWAPALFLSLVPLVSGVTCVACGGAGGEGGSGGAGAPLDGGDGAGAGSPLGTGGTSSGSGSGSASASGGSGSGGEGASAGGAPGAGGTSSMFDPCPAAPEPCQVMPSGDSITVGAQSTGTGGYRAPLFELAHDAGKQLTFVGPSGAGPETVAGVPFPDSHDGHSGYVIDTIDTRKGLLPLVPKNLAAFTPHIVLLMIGTNDMNSDLEVATAPERFDDVLEAMTTGAPNGLIVVAQLTPTRESDLNLVVEDFNDAIAELVDARVAAGQHLVLVDMYGAFTQNADYQNALLFDGLHPNDAGYSVMAGVWYQVLEQYLH